MSDEMMTNPNLSTPPQQDYQPQPRQNLCPECGQPMEEGYFMKGEAYWAYEKGILKGMTSREKVKTPRQAQAWRCQRCHLILFRY